MALGNICRCEFVKLSVFPGSTHFHLSNLDQKEKKNHTWEYSNFSLKGLCYPHWGNQSMLEEWGVANKKQ